VSEPLDGSGHGSDRDEDHADDHGVDGDRSAGRRPGRESDSESVARSVGLRLLTGAPRSRAELAAAMARKEVPVDVADAVLDRFAEVGLIDDAEYARILVRSRHADRGLSRRALGVELRRKGIDDELATAALGTLDVDQEEATARRLAQRRLASTSGLAREVRLRRVVAMLGRKGYSAGLAVRIVRDLLDAEAAARGADLPADRTGAVDLEDEWFLGGL